MSKRRPVVKNIEGIGDVDFIPSSRAGKVIISLRSSHRVRVSVPIFISRRQAEGFVIKKKDWIKKKQGQLARREEDYRRYLCDLPSVSETEGGRLLKRRLAELAAIYGFTYNRVSIRRQRTRWGSCSSKKNISLNLRLAMLPEILRDYVILHELLHTRFPHHGPGFWRELDRYVGDARGLRDRLKRIPLED